MHGLRLPNVVIDATNRTELVAKLREFIAEKAGDEPFEAEWGGAEDYRIVHVEDADGKEVLTPEWLQSISDGD